MDKNLPVNAGDMGLILDPGRLHMQLSPHAKTAGALKPWSHTWQLLKPIGLEPVLCNKKRLCNEKPMHTMKNSPHSPQLAHSIKDPVQPKIKIIN